MSAPVILGLMTFCFLFFGYLGVPVPFSLMAGVFVGALLADVSLAAIMKGMRLRVPQAPLVLMFTKSVGANATPIAFSDVYNALHQGLVDGQENPLPTIMAKKFYEVQSHIVLTGHITESMVTVISGHVWNKLTPDDQKLFADTLKEAAAKATESIEASERILAGEFKKLGKTVVEPDREAFRKAAIPLHNDESLGAGWTRAQYDELQALK